MNGKNCEIEANCEFIDMKDDFYVGLLTAVIGK
jgi:hypothetical protein